MAVGQQQQLPAASAATAVCLVRGLPGEQQLPAASRCLLCGLPEELIVATCRGLMAIDICALRAVCKSTMADGVVVLICENGGPAYAALSRAFASRAPSVLTPRGKKQQKPTTPTSAAAAATVPLLPVGRSGALSALAVLRVVELERVSSGLEHARDVSPSETPRGYWVSKNWASSARRHHERARAKLMKKQDVSSPRPRSCSSELPPWPDANSDLLCEHGALAPRNSTPRAKRLLVDRATWSYIKARFNHSTKLKASQHAECQECLTITAERSERRRLYEAHLEDDRKKRLAEIDHCSLKQQQDLRDGKELAKVVEKDDSALLRQLLSSRDRWKRGVALDRVSADSRVPLVPGRYHLVPRVWLQSWRKSLRCADCARPGPPNTSDLLCVLHGLPLIPPNVQAYLKGQSKHLLGDSNNNNCCEILHADEWRAVNAVFPVDFAVAFDVVAFDLRGTSVTWATPRCRSCDETGRADSIDLKLRPRKQRSSSKPHHHRRPQQQQQQQADAALDHRW